MICQTYPGINPLNVWEIEADTMRELIRVAHKQQMELQKQIDESRQ